MTLADSELLFKVIKTVETVGGIEFFVVLTMRAFHLAVVARGIGTDQLVTDTKALELKLKQSGFVIASG